MSSAICIILILFFLFFIPISLLEKKCSLILGFHDERDWVFMVSTLLNIYIYIYIFFFKIDLSWAFDHVCYKLFYGCLSLDCRNDTLNMFAIMYDN